jgi:BON domain
MSEPTATQTMTVMTRPASSDRAHRRRRSAGWLLTGITSGAVLAYLLDAERGRQRRDHAAAVVRHATGRLVRRARVTGLRLHGRTKGVLHQLCPPPSEPLDDAGLAHKVESVLFRDAQVPKGRISINAENGTVFLRGQVESPELIDDLTKSVRKIAGVSDVVNLLHLPGTPAPHHD